MATSQDFVNWVCTKAIDYRFLKYVLLAEKETLFQFASGTTHQTIYFPEVKAFHVCLPRPSEQARLVEVLGALDDKIELNRRMAETLEAMARTLFQSWFVDFDPVHAKTEGRPTGLPEAVAALFPDRFGEDGVPESWTSVPLSTLADVDPESWSRANYPPRIRYVDLTNTKWGNIESVEVHIKASAPSRAQRVLRPGDTIIGTVRPGNGSYALVADDGLTGSTGFAVLRPKRAFMRELVYLVATDPDNIGRLANLADGGAYPAVRPHVVAETEVAGFSMRIADAFSAIAAPVVDRIASSRRESATLTALRDTLLPRLISGELRIADAERAVAAVA